VFYDQETEIAKKCNEIQSVFEDSMFEEEEKRQLILNEKLNAIQKHEALREKYVDSEGRPLSPSGSDTECEDQSGEQVAFGPMIDSRPRDIWDATERLRMMDHRGVNVLDNERDSEMMDRYGIYHPKGIKVQAMRPPQEHTIDGTFLIENAKFVSKRSRRRDRAQKRRARAVPSDASPPGPSSAAHSGSTEQLRSELRTKELAAYLSRVRQQTIHRNH